MTAEASSNRLKLVEKLRALKYEDVDLSFLIGDGSPNSGYDRYGKYKIRFGWGIAFGLTAITALWVFLAFFPEHDYDFNDPELVWTRANSYWLIPLVLVSWFFVNKSDRKETESLANKKQKALAKKGLVTLPEGLRFAESAYFSDFVSGTGPENSFGLYEGEKLLLAFGETAQRWDLVKKPMHNLYGDLGPFPSLFIYAAVPGLETNVRHVLNPKSKIDWSKLPNMNQSAKATISSLASKYAVVIADGGIVVGLAEDTINGVESSLTATMSSPTGWKICLGILSHELADVVEGLA